MKKIPSTLKEAFKKAVRPSPESLVEAVMVDTAPWLKLLLKLGADPNSLYDGYTALHWAVFKNDSKKVGILIRYGAKANIKDKFDQTAFAQALTQKHPNLGMAAALLKAGGNVNENRSSATLLNHCIVLQQKSSVQFLLDHDATIDRKTHGWVTYWKNNNDPDYSDMIDTALKQREDAAKAKIAAVEAEEIARETAIRRAAIIPAGTKIGPPLKLKKRRF
jgi:hypothetical protein